MTGRRPDEAKPRTLSRQVLKCLQVDIVQGDVNLYLGQLVGDDGFQPDAGGLYTEKSVESG